MVFLDDLTAFQYNMLSSIVYFFLGGGEGGNNVTLPSPSKSEGARTPILILASDICFFT